MDGTVKPGTEGEEGVSGGMGEPVDNEGNINVNAGNDTTAEGNGGKEGSGEKKSAAGIVVPTSLLVVVGLGLAVLA